MKGLFGALMMSLIAGLLALGGSSGGGERRPPGWDDHVRDLSLFVEPLLVYSDTISATARGLVDGEHETALKALTLLRHVHQEYSDCPVAEESAESAPRGATATLERGCGTDFERVILAVSLLRAAGLKAYLAAATCASWEAPHGASLGNSLFPVWQVPGGDFTMLPVPTTGVDEFLAPTCPWGEWVPLAPFPARPRPIPEPTGPATITSIELDHQEGPSTAFANGKTPGLQRLADAMIPRLEQSPKGWPRHFKLRERWPTAVAPCGKLRLRLENPAGSLAATVLPDGSSIALAVDIRVIAPPSLAGARPYIDQILEALSAVQCSSKNVSSAPGIGYHEKGPAAAQPLLPREMPSQEQ